MLEFPETHESLLARMKDLQDGDAWRRFVALYRPVIYRLARGRGLQDADAQDLTQQVLSSIAQAIGRWEPDASKGRFRSWLSRIVRNAVINALTRRHPDVPVGGTDMVQRLQQEPEPDAAPLQDFDREYQRAVFRWSQEQVRREFSESTWDAFRLTTIEGRSVEQAAEQLGKSLGAVYAARSRVMRRLKEAVREFEDSEDATF